MTVLTSKLEVDQSMQPYLPLELAEIYSTSTPNAMAKAKKIVLIECLSPCTVTRV